MRSITKAAVVAAMLLLLAPASADAATKKPVTTTKKVSTTTLEPAVTATRLADDLFRRVNQERAARGIAALTWDPALAALATEWSGRLSTGKFQHRDLNTALALPQFDAFQSIGENIAKMPRRPHTGMELHRAWMVSVGHRENLLRVRWDSIGIGVVCDGKGNAWATQNFGRHFDSTAPDVHEPTPSEQPITAAALDSLSC